MTRYLRDTYGLSEVVKKRPAPAVIEHLRAAAADSVFTSSVCVMELRRYGRENSSTHGLAVVTRNVRHFERARGLDAQNWWE